MPTETLKSLFDRTLFWGGVSSFAVSVIGTLLTV
ncbi:hypothetical protein EV655_101103 [Rhodovulum euryhalinum]|uniref:Uncharacterized protein n=1 Tax=Rhodovulum euryhalinum TaxID=35805 RepID=A0A4R2KN24_9RHOB|nr:hypothetical protein EV655_101103 [Rhodovulum euryhalinum]